MNKASARKRESNLYIRQAAKGSLSKGWKKKYVIIRQNKGSSGKSVLLELYIEKGAHNKPVISLLLENVDSITRIPSKLREHAFEIKSGERNLFCVSAESEIEAYEWMDVFNQHLLEPKKELGKLPEIEDDFCKVSVIPNKDSQRLDLQGDYYTVVRNMKVFLYDPYTGQIKIQWDMHHLKKVLVTTKCHFRDKERIMHFCVSSRSEHGKAELHFFSLKAKRLADAIFEVLSGNISVTSRTTRSASMIFEITSKDLKKMMKNKDPESESVASLVMDEPSREAPAEISVQTIPEEMDPAEDKDLQKEPKKDVIQNSENENKEATIEQNDVQVNGDQDQSPADQVNGHVSEDNGENINGEVAEDQPPQDSASPEEEIPDSRVNQETIDVKEEDVAAGSGREKEDPEGKTESQNEIKIDTSENQEVPAPEPEGASVSESVPSMTVDSHNNDNAPTNSSDSNNEMSCTTNDDSPADGTEEVSETPEEEESKESESPKELNQVNTDNVVNEEGDASQEISETIPEHCEESKSPQETTDQHESRDSEQRSELSTVHVNPSESAECQNSTESNESTKPTDSVEPTKTPESAEAAKTTDSVEPSESTDSAEPTTSIDSTEPTNTTDTAEPTNSADSVEPTNTTDTAEPTKSTDSTEPASDSKPTDNQTLPHDTSTDSGFINDSVEPGASINTNNNNSRENLNDEVCLGVEKANVLPEYGLPVDVADLEDFSVIVYNQESPEKLV